MRSLYFILIIAITTISLFTSCQKENIDTGDVITVISGQDFLDRRDKTGNDSPSGSHYSLNIIGVSKDKSADMTGNNGHRIFVDLEGSSKINLTRAPQGEDFQVLDANGTDGRAEFQLPAPSDRSYTIYVRPLGTPGGSANITTCGVDPLTSENICSMETEIVVREKGKSKFTDITSKLVTITAAVEDLNGDGLINELDVATYDIFDDVLQDYYWQYDNRGLKLLQMRFYYND